MSKQRLSLSRLQEEKQELQKDLIAFRSSYNTLCKRIQESIETAREYPPLHRWSGARGCVGSLEMAISIIEQNIDKYNQAIQMVLSGEIENSDTEDRPMFGVIHGGDDE